MLISNDEIQTIIKKSTARSASKVLKKPFPMDTSQNV